ncbi:uncharacterized protein LOC108665886 [Hyalella azteca]|uniref:Uncharacterized protein LOC108665886 n=1 Tax=Hyalella azteca TaxID=294128 RepID=A0A8B7N2V2_HYAAZ|nr:uncharacterized protein LOC108665886 [Hyalella azteca]
MADLVAYLNSNKSGITGWWVDLTLIKGEWFWSDGTATTAATLGSNNNEACARLDAPPNYAPWDISCTSTYRYVCQYKV